MTFDQVVVSPGGPEDIYAEHVVFSAKSAERRRTE